LQHEKFVKARLLLCGWWGMFALHSFAYLRHCC
jgi:hypothetical protein